MKQDYSDNTSAPQNMRNNELTKSSQEHTDDKLGLPATAQQLQHLYGTQHSQDQAAHIKFKELGSFHLCSVMACYFS